MAYASFTFRDLHERFNVKATSEKFIPEVKPVAPGPLLIDSLAETRFLPAYTEKARCEYYVSPILREAWRFFKNQYTLFSGENLDADPELDINVECDFIISAKPNAVYIEAPVVCVVEAKKENMEAGLRQCAAQLVGAYRFNQKDGCVRRILYGCVTIGVQWQFIRLGNGTKLSVEPSSYFVDDLPLLLGVWRYLLTLANAKPDKETDILPII